MNRRSFLEGRLSSVAAVFATVSLLARPAMAAPKPAQLTAEPAQLAIGEVTPGEKKTLQFQLKNVGEAVAKNVRCKGAGFTFDKAKLSVEGGGSTDIEATYTAPKASVKKAKTVKATIVCGTAKLTATGTIKPPGSAEPKAEPKPGEKKPAEPGTAGKAGPKPVVPPAKISIAGCKVKQPAVALDHRKHGTTLKIACDTCHHANKGLKAGAIAVVKRCSECHADPKGKAGSCKTMSMTTNPFHVRCIGCHKSKGGAAPTRCADCHKK